MPFPAREISGDKKRASAQTAERFYLPSVLLVGIPSTALPQYALHDASALIMLALLAAGIIALFPSFCAANHLLLSTTS